VVHQRNRPNLNHADYYDQYQFKLIKFSDTFQFNIHITYPVVG